MPTFGQVGLMYLGRRAKIIAVLVAALFGLASCGDSVHIPDYMSGQYVYVSQDATEITVNLFRSTTTPSLPIRIPRSVINHCSGYARNAPDAERRVSEIPDGAVCDGIEFAVLYPDGRSYANTVLRDQRNWEAQLPYPAPASFGKNFDTLRIDQKLRWLRMSMKVLARLGDARTDNQIYFSGMSKTNRTYDGFTIYEAASDTSYEYYFDNSEDEIRRVQCFKKPSSPGVFCTVTMPLSDDILVVLALIDFRQHGGRAFLRERVRAFKNVYCPIFKCDQRALDAAKVGDTP